MGNLLIRWADIHKTGLNIIDEQHRGLVSMINSFYFHKNDPNIEHILVPTALMTLNFAKIHFTTEQQLMEESEYPEAARHAEAHLKLYNDLIKVERKCRRARDADGFLGFLKNWWLEHVNGEDRRYVAHMKEYFGNRV